MLIIQIRSLACLLPARSCRHCVLGCSGVPAISTPPPGENFTPLSVKFCAAPLHRRCPSPTPVTCQVIQPRDERKMQDDDTWPCYRNLVSCVHLERCRPTSGRSSLYSTDCTPSTSTTPSCSLSSYYVSSTCDVETCSSTGSEDTTTSPGHSSPANRSSSATAASTGQPIYNSSTTSMTRKLTRSPATATAPSCPPFLPTRSVQCSKLF